MATNDFDPQGDSFATAANSSLSEAQSVTGDEYTSAHGETLAETLDLDTWHSGANLVETYARLEQEVAAAVEQESGYVTQIRENIFPWLRNRPDAPPCAGVYQVELVDLERIHAQMLFNGAVEACDGTVASHDTLPVTITQIGVCLVSYRGDQGSWVHRIFRRDLRTSSGKDPIAETFDLLEHRSGRGAADYKSARDRLTDLARRGVMAYAERAVLLERSNAPWRMGHGNPTPYELLTGSGMLELVSASLDLLRRMVLGHRRFVFIPSAPVARELLSIGNALRPLEYALVDTHQGFLDGVAAGHYRGEGWAHVREGVRAFVADVGPRVVVGVFRVSQLAPARLFYAHIDHAHEAALIAMADSVLQEHRGFPLLIDLADKLCTATFGSETLAASTRLAYAAAGEPFRYLTERQTR